ncbi:sugar kinase [Peribacillus frigoritolerans]|uniref:sugar kinase n=1 Tax=Peribacillus frigoritolerans TaxID=450367 RepID=UPI000BED13CB|nr:sugar kinase [Peribacillus frigoritolerans]MCR8868114.1 sugar kinase [Peribacillus frigoritolerans]PEF39467.1 2-keto-3-deoxygluconate kinase [Bacillus sp. AFS094228]PEO48739.1 2-keto-3-deoxygluconate kinase [Bacillus sp. AFS026049]WVN08706.1 sugar kinase [Peribacillus frigoritolerans]
MSSKYGVLTLGDAMITLNPEETGPLRFVNRFERKVGGAELNFAIGCARLGLRSKWISRLGKDEFGKVIYNFARGEGVDMSDVAYVNGYPTSLNFKEIREDGSGKTFYYRYQSPILTLKPGDITEKMFEGIDIVHLTGVFLAIDPKNVNIAKRVMEIAKQKNIPVSFDPNIRLKLWSIEEARSVYYDIFPYVDILLTGLDEIRLIIGTDSKESLAEFAKVNAIDQLVIKDGKQGSKLYTKSEWHEKEAFHVIPVDTVGAGDGYDAGYIYGYLNGLSIDERLAFANGVGALVTTVAGDNEGLPYLDEVMPFIQNEIVIER